MFQRPQAESPRDSQLNIGGEKILINIFYCVIIFECGRIQKIKNKEIVFPCKVSYSGSINSSMYYSHHAATSHQDLRTWLRSCLLPSILTHTSWNYSYPQSQLESQTWFLVHQKPEIVARCLRKGGNWKTVRTDKAS